MSKDTSEGRMDTSSFLTPSRKIRSYEALTELDTGSHSLKHTTASTGHKMHSYDEVSGIDISPFNPENFLADQYNSQSQYDMVEETSIEDAICNKTSQLQNAEYSSYIV